MWAWPRKEGGQEESMELGIGRFGCVACDHLPCSFCLYFGAFLWFFGGKPPAKSAVKVLTYFAEVGPFFFLASFLFYLVIPSLSLVLLLCICVLHLYSLLIHQSLLPISICLLPIRS